MDWGSAAAEWWQSLKGNRDAQLVGVVGAILLLFAVVTIIRRVLWQDGYIVGGDDEKLTVRVWRLPSDGQVHVVGEAYYQAAFLAVVGPKTSESRNEPVLAMLVPEPSNPRDRDAVRVVLDGRTVGYLSRRDARDYRNVLDEVIAADHVPACSARVRGGWDRGGGDEGHFGMVLDLASPARCLETLEPAAEPSELQQSLGCAVRSCLLVAGTIAFVIGAVVLATMWRRGPL